MLLFTKPTSLGSNIAVDLKTGQLCEMLPVIGAEELPEQEWPQDDLPPELALLNEVTSTIDRVRGWFK